VAGVGSFESLEAAFSFGLQPVDKFVYFFHLVLFLKSPTQSLSCYRHSHHNLEAVWIGYLRFWRQIDLRKLNFNFFFLNNLLLRRIVAEQLSTFVRLLCGLLCFRLLIPLIDWMFSHHKVKVFLRNIALLQLSSPPSFVTYDIVVVNWQKPCILQNLDLPIPRVFLSVDLKQVRIFEKNLLKIVLVCDLYLGNPPYNLDLGFWLHK